MNTPKTISETIKKFELWFESDKLRAVELSTINDIEELKKSIKNFIRQSITEILDSIPLEEKETGIKMYPDKRTGEMSYLHGNSPSSVCIGCGQKKKAEEQGYNQKTREIKELLNKIRL